MTARQSETSTRLPSNRIVDEPATVAACARDLRPNDPTAPNGIQAAAAAARGQLGDARSAGRR